MALSVTPTDEMKTLKVGEKIYEIVDDQARGDVSEVKADLLQKANIDGAYSDLTAGNAEQLVSTVYEEDSVPYIFRTAGGFMDIGDREEDMLVGGSVVWNQIARPVNKSASTTYGITTTVTDNRLRLTGTPTYAVGAWRLDFSNIAVPEGHIYLLTGRSEHFYIRLQGETSVTRVADKATLKKASSTALTSVVLVFSGLDTTTAYDESFYIQLFDLTQMFGSTIADYIYSLETATPGAGVAWFRKLFPADYYPYDAGTLKSVEGVSSHDMVGFNAYNPTTGTAKLVGGQQYQITGAYSALTLDGEAVTPDASGYFTPTKSGTLTVTGGNSTITCVHLVWDGERDGEYEPYVKRSYPLDSSLTLRGIPKLDSANNLYYDGDRYLPDGTVERRYGIVDLGTLNYTYEVMGDGARAYTPGLANLIKLQEAGTHFVSTRFIATSSLATLYNANDLMWLSRAGNVSFSAKQYESSVAFKTAMSGVYLVYELATPTAETAEPYQNPQIVDDFGTEEYVTTSIVPVGHVTKYQPNLRAKLEMSPDSPDGDGDYIVRQANGENSYVSLASTTTIQDILARLTALEGNTT